MKELSALVKTDSRILDGFNQDIVPLMMAKFGFSEVDALREFVQSKTYQLLLDQELQVWHFSAIAIFDMWENEYVTGDLTNSMYIRGDEL